MQISVLVPVYNGARLLSQVIASVQAQTFRDWEMILIDDGSSDNTSEIAEKAARSDTRIKSFRNPHNLGLANTLNRALFISRGPFLARVDGDDVLMPNRFERQLAFLESHTDIDIVGGAALVSNANGRKRQVKLAERIEGFNDQVAFQPIVFHSSILIRRSFFERYGLYDSGLLRSQDRELWIRALQAGARFANLQEPVIEYTSNGYRRSLRTISNKTFSAFRIGRRYGLKSYRSRAAFGAIVMLLTKFGLYTPNSEQ